MRGVLKRAGLGVLAGVGLAALAAFGFFVLPYPALGLWLQAVIWGWL
ncbi:hypothetical protein [Leifsonia aquatica]